MKRRLAFVLVLIMLASIIFGCAPKTGDTGTPTPTPQPTAAATPPPEEEGPPFKLGMLIPGSATDGGFCQLGAEAARAIEEHFGAEIAIIEASTSDKMISEAEALIEDGYDIIFGHGGQYAAPFAEISPDYPDTIFITQGGDVMTDNQIPTFLAFEEACYLMGILAGGMTTTDNLGFVVGGSFPSYVKTPNAILLGAQSVNPDVKYQFAVLANIDMNEAYETTMNQIKGGADFVFSNANQGTLGSLKAAIESEGVYALGALADYSGDGPNTVLVSGICDYNKGYIATVEKALAGFSAGDYISVGLADGVTYLVWNEALKSKVPADLLAKIDDAQAKIISGELKVPGDLDQLVIK